MRLVGSEVIQISLSRIHIVYVYSQCFMRHINVNKMVISSECIVVCTMKYHFTANVKEQNAVTNIVYFSSVSMIIGNILKGKL